MRLVLATRNAHKVREFGELMVGHEVVALSDSVVLGPEVGETFADNALEKARVAAAGTGLTAIADDSGLEAAALHGRPGVRSARFAGPDATDAENLALLLQSAPPGSGLAYVCALAIVTPQGAEHVVFGRCEGTLAAQPRGDGGFGYDPAFLPVDDPAGRTMAELTSKEKGQISHRGRAVSELLAYLTSAG